MLRDPLLDWLALYGEAHGFVRDNRRPGYDPRTDFTQFLFRKGAEFEAAVVAHLAQQAELVSLDRAPRGDNPAVELTLDAMRRGAEVIYHPLVAEPDSRTFGEPDLLVRSDVLGRLFPGDLIEEGAEVGAAALADAPWHYRVVDIKLTTVRLSPTGWLANGGSAAAYRAQVYAYTRALGRMQGYEPPRGYILGRSWTQEVAGQITRGLGSMERLGPVNQQDARLAEQVEAATAWLRRVRTEGGGWSILPRPPVPELWPNLGHTQDGPWHQAKREIAEQIEDVTLLWGVGPPGRARAHAGEVYSWRDPAFTPALVGIHTQKKASTLLAILDINQRAVGPAVTPARIASAREHWLEMPPLEFYVDFETVGDLNDDFSAVPLRGGEPLIFMIGCGHVEQGDWRFTSFVAEALTADAEAAIVDQWFAHMDEVQRRLVPAIPSTVAEDSFAENPSKGRAAPRDREPLVIHWSPAEEATLETAYNSAAHRHPERRWQTPRWFDFLNRVVRAEPVAVRGAFSFGLKPIARAFHALGLIETGWDDAIADGLSAAAGAWWCDAEARRLGVSFSDLDLMRDIARYNEIDCKVMMEIVHYLRAHH